jgi:hypothetical protein
MIKPKDDAEICSEKTDSTTMDTTNYLKDKVKTDCYLEMSPPDYHQKLIQAIETSKTFKDNKRVLPVPQLLAFLYVRKNISILYNANQNAIDDNETYGRYCYWIHPEKIEEYLTIILRQRTIEMGVLDSLIKILHNRIDDLLMSVSSLNMQSIDIMLPFIHHMLKDYWYYKSKGRIDDYLLLANSINSILLNNNNQNARVIELLAETNFMVKNILKDGMIKKLIVNKPQELTLIIDISYEAVAKPKFVLLTAHDRLNLKKLLTNGEVKFICNLAELYSQTYLRKVPNQIGTISIPPGSVLFEKQKHSNGKTHVLADPKYRGYGVTPEKIGLTSVEDLQKTSKYNKGNHTYIIGTRIRQYLEFPTKKFVIFSQRNNSLITNIQIIIDTKTKKQWFGYHKRTTRSI